MGRSNEETKDIWGSLGLIRTHRSRPPGSGPGGSFWARLHGGCELCREARGLDERESKDPEASSISEKSSVYYTGCDASQV